MPVVKEFSAVSGRATNSDSLAARAVPSGPTPGNNKAARVTNDFQRRFRTNSEARIPKSERNPKSETRKLPFQSAGLCHFLHRASEIRISEFAFKICIGFQCSCCSEWLMASQAGKQEVQAKISKKWIREARGSARRGEGFQPAFDRWQGNALQQRRVRSSGAFARSDRALCRSGTFARLGP